MKRFVIVPGICLLLVILASGCINNPSGPVPVTSSPVPPATPEPLVTVLPAAPPGETVSPVTAIPTPLFTPEKKSYTTDEVNRHLVAIIGTENSRIYKQSGNLRMGLEGQATDEDFKTVVAFNREFNNLAPNLHLPEEEFALKKISGVIVSLLPEATLREVNRDTIRKNVTVNGQVKYYIGTSGTQVYVNSDLKGDERKHYLVRAILEVLNFNGEDYAYPDSIFNPDAATVTQMSGLDAAAAKVLYSNRIASGMSPDEVRKALFMN